MKKISEYKNDNGAHAIVHKSLREQCFVVQLFRTDGELLQTIKYPHLDKAEASAEDYVLNASPISLDDVNMVECGAVTMKPVDNSVDI